MAGCHGVISSLTQVIDSSPEQGTPVGSEHGSVHSCAANIAPNSFAHSTDWKNDQNSVHSHTSAPSVHNSPQNGGQDSAHNSARLSARSPVPGGDDSSYMGDVTHAIVHATDSSSLAYVIPFESFEMAYGELQAPLARISTLETASL